jgi:zinc transporter ZupT
MVNSDQNVSSPVKELQRISTQSLVGFGLAICSHSLIDGLAIGIFSDIGTITVLAVCVIIHKIPVACTVGTTFKSQSQELMAPSTIVVFVAFILATPIGMTIGMSIQESDETLLVFPIIQALSGGTFVYIACCDLLIHEFRHNTG